MLKIDLILQCIVIHFLAMGCKATRANDSSNISDFYIPKVGSEKLQPEFKLDIIESSSFKGEIKYSAKLVKRQYHGYVIDYYESLKVEFEKLSQEQFSFLKKSYGNDTSKVVFRPNPAKAYRLKDFLPPVMQALQDKEWFALPGQTSTNCWSTAYEVSTGATNMVSIYVISPIEVVDILRDTTYTTMLQPGQKLRPGDLIVDWWEKDDFISPSIGHAVIYVDNNVFFEKSGMGDSHFHLATNSYLPAKTDKATDQPYYFRLRQKSFPSAAERMSNIDSMFQPVKGVALKKTTYAISYDISGRADLDQKIIHKEEDLLSGQKRSSIFVESIPKPSSEHLSLFERLKKTHADCLETVYHRASDVWLLANSKFKRLDCLANKYSMIADQSNNHVIIQMLGSCRTQDKTALPPAYFSSITKMGMGDLTVEMLEGGKSLNFKSEFDCGNAWQINNIE